MEIGLRQGYPGAALSNLAQYRFVFRSIECHSAEGVLQATKKRDPNMQRHICQLAGMAAKMAGGQSWKKRQTLYWQGKPMKRDSQEYQDFLDELYDALFAQCPEARKALLAQPNCSFEHSLGKRKQQDTVLTRTEFTGRLYRVRSELLAKQKAR